MSIDNLRTLAALIAAEREQLLATWRLQVRQLPSARDLDVPALNDHIPALLDELIRELSLVSDKSIPEAMLEGSPPVHGIQRYKDGFDIVEVVAEYNILRGCIHELAEGNGLELRGRSFHILNRVLDESIGLAVQTFATQKALEVQKRREEYLAFVAHDLRTPLNAISLAAKVLERGPDTRDAAGQSSRMLKTLHRNVAQLESLVDKVLKESAHVRTESGVSPERRELDLWPLVESLLHDLKPLAATSGAQLVNEIPEDLTAYADAGLLRRVLQNLVANAIGYTPRGEVVVGARQMSSPGAIECWVSDNGAGIPEDQLGSIFEKFATDPEKEGGTGLGLAIVKTFVEGHGGRVTVESKEGSGSTFRFTLPGRAVAA